MNVGGRGVVVVGPGCSCLPCGSSSTFLTAGGGGEAGDSVYFAAANVIIVVITHVPKIMRLDKIPDPNITLRICLAL